MDPEEVVPEECCHSCFHWRELEVSVTIADVTVEGSYMGCTQDPLVFATDGPCGLWSKREVGDVVAEESVEAYELGVVARELYEELIGDDDDG